METWIVNCAKAALGSRNEDMLAAVCWLLGDPVVSGGLASFSPTYITVSLGEEMCDHILGGLRLLAKAGLIAMREETTAEDALVTVMRPGYSEGVLG